MIQGQNEIGGIPKSIVWNGFFLAISFKNTNSVVVYHTNVQKYDLTVTPAFFISGLGAEYPSCIAFQPEYESFKESKRSVLCIGWNLGSHQGRIQYFPLM